MAGKLIVEQDTSADVQHRYLADDGHWYDVSYVNGNYTYVDDNGERHVISDLGRIEPHIWEPLPTHIENNSPAADNNTSNQSIALRYYYEGGYYFVANQIQDGKYYFVDAGGSLHEATLTSLPQNARLGYSQPAYQAPILTSENPEVRPAHVSDINYNLPASAPYNAGILRELPPAVAEYVRQDLDYREEMRRRGEAIRRLQESAIPMPGGAGGGGIEPSDFDPSYYGEIRPYEEGDYIQRPPMEGEITQEELLNEGSEANGETNIGQSSSEGNESGIEEVKVELFPGVENSPEIVVLAQTQSAFNEAVENSGLSPTEQDAAIRLRNSHVASDNTTRPLHSNVAIEASRDAKSFGDSNKPGGQNVDILTTNNVLREVKVVQKAENWGDPLMKAAGQFRKYQDSHTDVQITGQEVYVQIVNTNVDPEGYVTWLTNQASQDYPSLSGIYLRVFDQYGNEIWAGTI